MKTQSTEEALIVNVVTLTQSAQLFVAAICKGVLDSISTESIMSS